MKSKAVLAARLLLGLLFFVFGLNGFLHFLPQPPMEPGKALDFLTGLMAAPYMFPLIKGTEVFAGILLLTGIAVPFALILLAPIVVNIALFHTVLNPNFMVFPIIIALGLFLAWNYKERYAPLFKK